MDNNNNPKISKPHFLFVTFPAQGHINPSLELAKRLARTIPGSRVTFAAAVSAYNRQMFNTQNAPENLVFATYSDGYDEGFKRSTTSSTISDNYHEETKKYMSKMRSRGKETLTKLIEDNHIEGKPFTCIIYTILLTWVATLAREFHVRSALLWVQPVTVFSIFYHYFNGYKNVISDLENTNLSGLIELPSLPPLLLRDLPSFIVPSSCYAFLIPAFEDQIESLKQKTNPTILVNSFQELEPEALNSVPDVKIIPIGPLITGRIDSSVSDNREMYMKWLDTKPDSSVIYISFGTIAVLCKKQLTELTKALLSTRRPFLWVITDKSYRFEKEEETEEEMILRCFKEEIDEIGMVISWCDQFAVLNHKAIGCFVTHCGWNSTLESLVSGVPAVAFPQWSDQMTNAKLLEDCWKIGVRVTAEETVVESDEIRRCIEEVMETVAFRENAAGWRDLAAEAVREGGSSFNNLKGFVDELM